MHFFQLLSEAYTQARVDKVPQLAASTAYYTIFSLAPLIVLLIAVLGYFFDESSARALILDEIDGLVGRQGAEGIGSMVDAARLSTSSTVAIVIGVMILLLGATGLMIALQDAVNFIWKVRAKKTTNKFLIILLKRFFSIAFILGIGFLLLVSLAVSAVLAAFTAYLQRYDMFSIALPALNAGVSFGVIWILFAALLKFLPDVLLSWRDVLPGSALTALLFVVGKTLLGWYLGQKDAVTAYGIAGSLIIVLLWINYSSHVLFFGVEFTKVYTLQRSRLVVPKEYAEAVV